MGSGGPQASLGAVFRESGCFFPQNDPDKEYNMPKDGTVHELTSNVGAAQGHLGGERPSLATAVPDFTARG